MSETLKELGMAKETIEEIAMGYPGAIAFVIGANGSLKTAVMEYFAVKHYCYMGKDPTSWLLTSGSDTIREMLSRHQPKMTVFNIDEKDATSLTLRELMVEKLKDAGFYNIIGVYLDNNYYLRLEKHVISKYATAIGDSEPFISAEQIREAITRMSGMNEASREICTLLASDPPSYSEFNCGLVRMVPTWALAL